MTSRPSVLNCVSTCLVLDCLWLLWSDMLSQVAPAGVDIFSSLEPQVWRCFLAEEFLKTSGSVSHQPAVSLAYIGFYSVSCNELGPSGPPAHNQTELLTLPVHYDLHSRKAIFKS